MLSTLLNKNFPQVLGQTYLFHLFDSQDLRLDFSIRCDG